MKIIRDYQHWQKRKENRKETEKKTAAKQQLKKMAHASQQMPSI